jgi:hypothetical protein
MGTAPTEFEVQGEGAWCGFRSDLKRSRAVSLRRSRESELFSQTVSCRNHALEEFDAVKRGHSIIRYYAAEPDDLRAALIVVQNYVADLRIFQLPPRVLARPPC